MIFSNYFCKTRNYKLTTTKREEKIMMMWWKTIEIFVVFVFAQQSNVFGHRLLFDFTLYSTDWWNLLKLWTKESGLRGQNPTRFSWNLKQEMWSLNSKGLQLKLGSYGVYSLDTWWSQLGQICVIGALKKGPNNIALLD